MCEGCGRKPQAYHSRRWCYDCKPGTNGRPRPCRRCGSTGDYWAERLCRRCHQYAPQELESCRDCLAWGVRRTQNWLCEPCRHWRSLYSDPRPCVSCGEQRSANDQDVCRLCWHQARARRPRLGARRRGPIDIAAANADGQQLFFANWSSFLNDRRNRPRRPDRTTARGPAPRKKSQGLQLNLLAPDPIRNTAKRYGFSDPPDARLAFRLDTLACEHAARHGWTTKKTNQVRVSIRVLLGMRQAAGTPIRATDVMQLIDLGLVTHPVMAMLKEADLLDEDRPATIETWFQGRIVGLPEAMTGELQIWFDVLHHGSLTPPRSRPRTPSTIKCRLGWSLPTLHDWAIAGHQSLREISREDILAVLPTAETPRAKLGSGLRSIFGTLKARKVIFVNPMARIQVGNFARTIPLPGDTHRLRKVLNSSDPSCAALAALLVFHGLRPAELRELQLTDVHDGRLFLADRTVPLADPVKARLASYLDYRHQRWPNSINPYFFIHYRSAGTVGPIKTYWVNGRLGMSAQAIRQDRMVDEAQATGGDLRRMSDFFGVTIDTAAHYASMLNHPELTNGQTDSTIVGSATEGPV